MNKLSSIIGIFLTLMALTAAFAPTAPVFADIAQETVIGEVTEPGILPDSGFYFMKNWGRSLQLMFAAGNTERAELHIRYSNEDVLAIKKLCDMGQCDVAARYTEQYELQIQNAIQNIEQARLREGVEIADRLTSDLEQNYLRQQEILAGVLEQAPEPAQDGILNAIENSNRHVANLIREQKGEAALEQYQEQVTQQTNNMGENTRLQIQQRLEASHGQSNKPSTITGDSQQISDNVTGIPPQTVQENIQGQGAPQQTVEENIQGQGASQSSGQGHGNSETNDHGNKK